MKNMKLFVWEGYLDDINEQIGLETLQKQGVKVIRYSGKKYVKGLPQQRNVIVLSHSWDGSRNISRFPRTTTVVIHRKNGTYVTANGQEVPAAWAKAVELLNSWTTSDRLRRQPTTWRDIGHSWD